MLRMTLHRFRLPLLSLAMGLLLVPVLVTLAGAQTLDLAVITDLTNTDEIAEGETVEFAISYKDLPALDPNTPIVLTVDWTGPASFLTAILEPQREGNRLIWNPLQLLDANEKPRFTLQVDGEPAPITVSANLSYKDSTGSDTTLPSNPVVLQVVQPIQPTAIPVPSPSPDLITSSLVITPTEVVAGTSVSLTVVLTNTGDTPLSDVVISVIPSLGEVIPAVRASSNTLVEPGPSIDSGISFGLATDLLPNVPQKIDLEATIPSTVTEGTLQFNATISAAGSDLSLSPREVTILPPPTVDLKWIDTPLKPQTGGPLSLLLRLKNSGAVPIDKLKVRVSPGMLLDLAASGEGMRITPAGADVMLELATPLEAGALRDITLSGRAPSTAGALKIEAMIEDSDPPLAQNVAVPFVTTLDVQPVQTVAPAATPTTPPAPTATAAISPTVAPAEATPAPDGTTPPGPNTGLPDWLIPALAVILLAILVIVVALVLLRRPKTGPVAEPVPPPTAPTVPIVPPPPPPSGAFLQSVAIPALRMRLKDGVTTIGRDPDCDIRITEKHMNWETVSHRHAEIRREGARYVIYDVSKRNGVYVQGSRTAKNILRPGMPVNIGGVEFIFHEGTETGQ